jgi:hypothetical protein
LESLCALSGLRTLPSATLSGPKCPSPLGQAQSDRQGDYLDVTGPEALAFHPKAYIFERAAGTGVAFVGSSNLSHSALLTGIEWNYRAVSNADAAGFQEIRAAFDRLFDHPPTKELTRESIDAYRQRRPAREAARRTAPIEVPDEPATIPVPHAIQQEALEALEATRAQGNAAGLVVLATRGGRRFRRVPLWETQKASVRVPPRFWSCS